MSKKKGYSKKKRYSKKDFKSIVCQQCISCKSVDPDPTFCYDFMYMNGDMHQRKSLLKTLMSKEGFNIDFFNDAFCSPFTCSGFEPHSSAHGLTSERH